LQGFPVDLTLLFFVVTFCFIGWAIVSGRMDPVPLSLSVLLMILFSEFAATSLFWSSLDALNTEKVLRFLLLTSPSFFAAHMLAQDRSRRERLLRMLAWLSCAILLYYAYYRYVVGVSMMNEYNEDTGRISADSYQEYGDHASILFIICLAVAAFGSLKQLWTTILGSGAMFYALVAVGGRGALAQALLAVPVLAFGLLAGSTQSLRRLTRLGGLLFGLIGLAALGFLALEGLGGAVGASEQKLYTLDRFEGQLSNEDTLSMDLRYDAQSMAFSLWLEKPLLGWGIGEFRVKDPYLKYPHNLLLELLMEMGIVGAFLFFAVCVIATRDCVRIARDRTCSWIEAAIALLFLTDLATHLTVQGYLADDRVFLTYIGLVIGSRPAASRYLARFVPFAEPPNRRANDRGSLTEALMRRNTR
jgi:O-antigen ligase